MARGGASRRRRTRRRAGGTTRSLMGYLLIGLLVVLGLGVLIAVSWLKPPEYDKTTLCPKAGPEAGLVILLDLTDRIGSTHPACAVA